MIRTQIIEYNLHPVTQTKIPCIISGMYDACNIKLFKTLFRDKGIKAHFIFTTIDLILKSLSFNF